MESLLQININHYLILATLLFTIGVIGVLSRRNAIIIFMSIELMLNSVNLSLIAFSSFLDNSTGHILVLFVMTVAAAEVAVGLALIVIMHRNKDTIKIDSLNLLKG